jgi:outer membrane biogenesis lipoprotein LolB
VAGLAWWVQGAPREDAPYSLEADVAGRASVLRQDGCEIVYAYAESSARRPSRLTLVCHDVELRIVIDRWRAA